MDWQEIVFYVATSVLPFLAGMLIFSKWVFRDMQVRWGLGFNTQVLFSLTLVFSFQAFAAILGELSGFLSKATRDHVWFFDLFFLVLLLKGFLPFLAIFAFSEKLSCYPLVRFLFSIGIFSLVFFFENSWGWEDLDLQHEIQSLGKIGLGSVAILSGWGSVHGPYAYGNWFVKQYSDREIQIVHQKLLSVTEMQSRLKRKALRHMCSQTEVEEVQSLALLQEELFLEFNAMNNAKNQSLFRKTWLGHVYTGLGYLFAAYCVYKVIASVYGILFPKTLHDPDFITNTLRILLFIMHKKYVFMLQNVVSFFMVGVLVFNSFRGLIVALGRVFHQIGAGRDSVLVCLLLTEVMGLYLLSSLILLDMNVPVKFRSTFLFGRFEFFRVWSDAFYLAAVVCSFALVYWMERAQQSRTEFYSPLEHEKMI